MVSNPFLTIFKEASELLNNVLSMFLFHKFIKT